MIRPCLPKRRHLWRTTLCLPERGRIGIFEMMQLNSEIRNLAFERAPTNRVRKAALASGCTKILSEDMTDGREFDTVVVENPFRAPTVVERVFETLAQIIRELDPGAVPVPLLQAGVTDARFFAQLGVQNYGFLPLRLPADFAFTTLIHAADERVPADAIEFGTEAVFRALQRLG